MKKKNDFAGYTGLIDLMSAVNKYPLSFLSAGKQTASAWSGKARRKMFELLAFAPKDVPFSQRLKAKVKKDGVIVETLEYSLPYGPETEAYFLYPQGAKGKLPGVVALHDHGGFKYFGKEKITELPGEHRMLKGYREEYYGGRAYANELARQGYAVLVHDCFMWGSRRFHESELSDSFLEPLKGNRPGSEGFIKAYNSIQRDYENIIAKYLITLGTTIQGVFSYEDRRAVDFLFSRKEVDTDRIGCLGLSGGGLRTAYLAGLDERVKCAVCVGFMDTFEGFLDNRIKNHTWMLNLPYQSRYMDFTDMAAIRVPSPLMVQYDIHDGLYTLKGQKSADKRLASIYKKAGAPENYRGMFYPGPHKFDVPMQEDAFRWFEQKLR